MLKQQKGMTLLGLVFTILVMLALAAIAIAMVFDELKYDPAPVEIHTEQHAESKETPNPEETPTPGTVETPTESSAEPQEN